MNDLFDGSADLRRYERTAFEPHRCELLSFECYDKYTLTRLRFESSDVFVFIVKSKVTVEPTPNGAFAHFIGSGAALVFSVGGSSYISNAKAVQVFRSDSTPCFAGFDALGTFRLTPDGALSAVESGVVHGSEASPFLVLNGKRLTIKDEAKRSRDRLLLAQLRTGEPAFIYIKGVDVARAANYAFQLGCSHAAVIANERRIDIYGKGVMQDRQSGCKAAFVVR